LNGATKFWKLFLKSGYLLGTYEPRFKKLVFSLVHEISWAVILDSNDASLDFQAIYTKLISDE